MADLLTHGGCRPNGAKQQNHEEIARRQCARKLFHFGAAECGLLSAFDFRRETTRLRRKKSKNLWETDKIKWLFLTHGSLADKCRTQAWYSLTPRRVDAHAETRRVTLYGCTRTCGKCIYPKMQRLQVNHPAAPGKLVAQCTLYPRAGG